MNENNKPVSSIVEDPARMLISPPPEEELQRTRTHMLKPFNGPKRKRGGTPTKPQEATPNPKPRKTHRRRTSSQLQQDSPTRTAFARSNPNADYISTRRSQSVTPYEPPTDVFTPPREIRLAPSPAPKSSRGASTKPKPRTTPQPRPRTPLRVVVHSVKKEPLPAIDLARPMTPPSPTDDPLLLLPSSSSPVKRRATTARFLATYDDEDEVQGASSDAAYAPIDWTAGVDVDAQDALTSDSMDLDPPASFDGPLPHTVSYTLPPAHTTQTDTDDILPHTPTQPQGVSFTAGGGWDSDDDDDALPVPPATTTTTTTAPVHTTATTTTTTHTPNTNTTLQVTDFLQPTKPDPPTPRTQARAERWGVWGSPFPGRGVYGEEGEGSFRMDGRRRGGAVAGFPELSGGGGEQVEVDGERQEEEEEEDEEEDGGEDSDSDASMEEGVSILHALREEDARRRASRRESVSVLSSRQPSQLSNEGGRQEDGEEDGEQEQEEEEEEDEDEREEAEVRAMSVDPDLEDAPAPHGQQLVHPQEEREEVRTPTPTPARAFDFGVAASASALLPASASASQQQQQQAAQTQTPPYRWAPGVAGQRAGTPVRSLVLGASGALNTAPALKLDLAASAPRATQDQGRAQVQVQDDEVQDDEMHDAAAQEKRVYAALGMRLPQSLVASPSKERLGNEHVHRARARASFGRVDPGEALLPSNANSNSNSNADVEEEVNGDVDQERELEGGGEDDSGGDEEEEDAALLGLVKITSADPRAAARAAAILKQHDYDCFTRLRHSSAKERERRRHSYGGVSKHAGSPVRGFAEKNGGAGRMQDIAVLRAGFSSSNGNSANLDPKSQLGGNAHKEAKEQRKEKAQRRQSARVVGERVYFPGSPKPVTTAELLAEAEREVVGMASGVGSPGRGSASASARGDIGGQAERTTPRRVPLPESESDSSDSSGDEEDAEADSEAATKSAQRSTEGSKTWGKPEWKALDACFTDERIAVAERLGMVLNLVPAPAPGTAFSTPVRKTTSTSTSAVMMASADAVDLAAVVARFVDARGGEGVVCSLGPGWDVESLIQRARALQNKQRAGHVAPPTPTAASAKSSLAFPTREDGGVFAGARRQASMVVPDFTPLGKRAMPPRASSSSPRVNAVAGSSNLLAGRARLPAPVLAGAPFSQLPPTPEPLRKRRVPGSLFAPRYSHLLEEAVAVSGSGKGKERAVEREEEDEEWMEDGEEQEQESEQQDESSFSTDPDSSLDADAEMAPATPLREREEAALYAQPAATEAPASVGKRVKGFLFSYLPTLAKTAPPPRTAALLARPRLPLPPLELLEKPRGPVVTPVRPPLPKTRAPKELVSLQPAPPVAKKTGIPRRAPPRRMVELNHVEMPVEAEPVVRVGPRPRTSSGGSVKDLVKNFERLDKETEKQKAEVKRVRSVGDFGGNSGRKGAVAGAGRPVWR
ncbi:hypothetical protein B0H16DRAFT_462041 [Mycena metata]|uniref:Uncharacterized protein n=1 Tax=Mycena metata TaxID=1033252 RepID=A0AAD7HAM1_9AGAR|nr:hypothetical protein B0H16DRAFT_462041 [Mycena metata]